MKNTILSAAAIMTIASSAWAADTGTIQFNGAVTETTCTINVDGASNDATVTLPTVSASSLSTATSVSGKTQFNLSLSNCSGGELTAKAFFEPGSTVDSATGRLINTDTTDPATNVSLQLLDGTTDAAINVGDYAQASGTDGYVNIEAGSATLPYSVQYYAEADNVGAGAVASKVTYSISYQ
ncbi:fimbrial protein [uncultured Leclercia sp.]|uniref:fimbrial protein n=1 Tax=uncultured Leclercia sp. TaxID=332959 RepID=UPI002599D46E|nr:fimbrial protein [uncultured Leclercia sp.]